MDNNGSVLQVQSGVGKFGGFRRLKYIDPEHINVDLNQLWAKVVTQEYAFDDFSRGNAEWFLLQLADNRNRYYLIDDVGLVILQGNMVKGGDCHFHFVVWDRNFSLHSDKEPAYEILDWLFYEVGVHRVAGYVPSYNRLAERFALSLGFKYEGELQESVLWKGKYHNVKLYGLLEGWYSKRKERILQ